MKMGADSLIFVDGVGGNQNHSGTQADTWGIWNLGKSDRNVCIPNSVTVRPGDLSLG